MDSCRLGSPFVARNGVAECSRSNPFLDQGLFRERVPTPIELAQWVLRAQCGDRDALELVLRTVQPALWRYVAGLVGVDDADDILQDVLLIVSRKLYWLE